MPVSQLFVVLKTIRLGNDHATSTVAVLSTRDRVRFSSKISVFPVSIELRTYLDARVDKALGTRKLGLVLDFDENQEVQVVPHVVLILGVLVERDGLVVEFGPIQTADEARVFKRVVLFLLGLSQIAESVDDDTKDEVESDDDDDEEEQEIVDHSEQIQRFLNTHTSVKKERSIAKSVSHKGPSLTELLGLRNTSPIPPPFLKPLLSVVMMHMMSVSQARSSPSPSTSLSTSWSIPSRAETR